MKHVLERIRRIESQCGPPAKTPANGTPPVVYFITSVHTDFLGLCGAMGLLSSWFLRLRGQPVVYAVCQEGVSQCVLGSNREDCFSPPPCAACAGFRSRVYPAAQTYPLKAEPSEWRRLRRRLEALFWEELLAYEEDGWAYGELCLPSLRWVQRAFTLRETDFNRRLLREYIISAICLRREVESLLDRLKPRAVVLYNATFYPEAVARRVCLERGVRAVSYEAGYRGISAFFSHGTATDYRIPVPEDFIMGAEENRRLDRYLRKRFCGRFKMGARAQWLRMEGLPPDLKERIRSHRRVVTIFTNTVWDTVQASAHVFFEGMFDWLRATLDEASGHPETLFVVRVHPDEMRPEKPSRETVPAWMREKGLDRLPNVVLIPGDHYVSSYELIRASHFCAVYCSTVGLEAAILGRFVLPGGKTRYDRAGVCHPTLSREDYLKKFRELLEIDHAGIPAAWRENARRFFYFSIFHSSLDFSGCIRPMDEKGLNFAFSSENIRILQKRGSVPDRVIYEGITQGKEFYATPREEEEKTSWTRGFHRLLNR